MLSLQDAPTTTTSTTSVSLESTLEDGRDSAAARLPSAMCFESKMY